MQKKKIPSRLMIGSSLMTIVAVLPAHGLPTLSSFDSAYQQNFDTLSNSGTSAALPDGWSLGESGSGANSLYGASTGSSNTGDTYSFGASGSTDRAFGTLLSTSVSPLIGLQLLNDTGLGIESLLISFTGEQWRLGATGREDRLDFQFSLDATSLITGTWTDVNALDFKSPIQSGSVGALDGNSAANQAALAATIDGFSLADGSTIWFRWVDFNAAGSDDGLAIDNFSAKAVGTSASSVPDFGLTLGLLGVGWCGITQLRRRLD